MKILIIGTSVVPIGLGRYGGIEKLCGDFIDGLHEVGHAVTVAAPQGSKVPDGVELIETVKLPEEQDRDDVALQKWTENNLDTFDVIHDFSHHHALTTMRKSQPPALYMFWHPMVYKYDQAKYNAVCLSNWQRGRFEKLYNQKAVVMLMCVDTKKYALVSHPRRERFLFLGKISPEKGVHLAIQYCRRLGVPLDVVGGLIPSETRSPYLMDIHKLCDGNQIKLHFNVTEEEKVEFLQNARALIYPVQQDEAEWLVGIEAAACGTAAITYNRGAFYEAVYGFVVNDEAAFKRAMFASYIDQSGMAPDQWAHRYHSKDVVIPKYVELYKRVAAGERW